MVIAYHQGFAVALVSALSRRLQLKRALGRNAPKKVVALVSALSRRLQLPVA